jgi:uncharacterized membrane-anchored protein
MTRSDRPRPKPGPGPDDEYKPKHDEHPVHKAKHKQDDNRVPRWITSFLVVVISLVWVTSFVAGLLNPKYQVPEQVNLLFSSMVGGLLLHTASRRRGGDEDE